MVYQNQVKTEVYYNILSMEISRDMVNTHFNMMLPQEAKNGPFQGQQGEGVALSFLGLQDITFTTEIPQDFSGEEIPTPKSRSSLKRAQNEAFQGLRVFKLTQTTKHS